MLENARPAWPSRVLQAYHDHLISAGEVWDILLDHLDDPAAEQRVDRLLLSLQRIMRPETTAPAEEWLIVTEDAEESANLAIP